MRSSKNLEKKANPWPNLCITSNDGRKRAKVLATRSLKGQVEHV